MPRLVLLVGGSAILLSGIGCWLRPRQAGRVFRALNFGLVNEEFLPHFTRVASVVLTIIGIVWILNATLSPEVVVGRFGL